MVEETGNYDFESMDDDAIDALLAEAEAENPVERIEAKEEQEPIEDTDQLNELEEEEVVDEAETNEQIDDEVQDTEEDDRNESNDEEEENSQVEEDNTDSTEETTDSKETEDQSDGDDSDTDTIDYKKRYEELQDSNKKLQDFYNEVTADFKANGKTVKGFKDPKKFIQANQMAAGLSEKMSAFKPYRKYMDTINKQGWLENPEKFDMAVNLMNKDEDAIKQLIKDSGIDVLSLDLDNINYSGKRHTASDQEVLLNDVIDTAKSMGVDADLERTLGGKWADDGSLQELLSNQTEAYSFVNHLSKSTNGTSVFDEVQSRIAQKRITDPVFGSKKSIDQYREAAAELEREFNESVRQSELEALKAKQEAHRKQVEEEKLRIAKAREESEYKAKLESEQSKVKQKRKKANSISQAKPKVNKTEQKFDPLKLTDDELDDFLLTLK